MDRVHHEKSRRARSRLGRACAAARLAPALGGGNSPAGARRLVLMEYPYFATIAREMALGDQFALTGDKQPPIAGPLNVLSPFLFNPIATVNCYGDYIYELAALAEA